MKFSSWIVFAALLCGNSYARDLGGIRTPDTSILNNVGIVLFGLLVGTLLVCCFDPEAKEFIRRGFKSRL